MLNNLFLKQALENILGFSLPYKASDIMRRELVKAKPYEKVKDVVKKMFEHNVGSVLIVDDEEKLVGIFTERDLVKLVATGGDLEEPVSKYMSKRPLIATPDEPVLKLASVMIEHGLRHLPVVDERGRLVGIVSIRDVLRALLSFESFP